MPALATTRRQRRRLASMAPLALLSALLLLQGVRSAGAPSSGEAAEYLDKCCGLGNDWGGQKLRCERFTGPVAGVPRDEQAACLEAVDICCRKSFQERDCEQGKADARAGLECSRLETGARRTPVGFGDFRRDCCEGCKLGMMTGSSGKSCSSRKLVFGIPWEPSFVECCNEAKTTTAQDSTKSTTPAKSTSTSTVSTTAETDEFDIDDLDDVTDPTLSTSFDSGDLCKIMKGLLCTDICVPTPGSYYCKCNPGSTLQADGRTCKSNVTTTAATKKTTLLSTTLKITKKPTTAAPKKKTTTKKPTSTTKKSVATTAAKSTTADVKTTKPMSPLSTLKAMTSKLRTTRSASTEDNELVLCPLGYRWSASSESCDDIDECKEGSHNCGSQKCYNLPGTYQCAKAPPPINRKKSTTAAIATTPGCGVGSRKDPRGGCLDVNECTELADACASNERCVNTPGSFHCDCLPGFRREDLTQACVDINECLLGNDCLASQRCDNTIGSYTCVRFLPCGTGYTLNAATEICVDDDECQMGTHDCGPGWRCRNTLGSYRCDKDRKPATTARPTLRTTLTTRGTPRSTPARPTTTDGTTTPVTTTSARTTSTTRTTTTTTTTPRPTTTTVPPKTTKKSFVYATPSIKPKTTTEVVPTVGTLATTTRARPPPAVGSRFNARSCPSGFESGPQGQCIDIDECHRNVHMCGNLRCINTIGSFRCETRLLCGIGFAPDPVSGQCKDLDECATGTHQCGHEQRCENRPGHYVCYCPPGHEIGSNHDCVDIDECTRSFPGMLDNKVCGEHGRCVNTKGSYRCVCEAGFESDPVTKGCLDVDECRARPGVCQQDCYNTWGGYRCGCRFGYRLRADNRTCDDVDECTEFRENNLCVGICENTPGSYACKCPNGYTLSEDRRVCQDIDECSRSPCSPKELCQNTRGGYRCNKIVCPEGYIRDPQRKNRCVRQNLYCSVNDQACFQRPAHYTYNYIAIVSMYPIPANTGQVELFTMQGTYNMPGSSVRFSMAFIHARAPPNVVPATESCFALRKPFPNRAVLVMTRSLQGPQDIELEFSMEIYGPSGTLSGAAVARIFIIVTPYEF